MTYEEAKEYMEKKNRCSMDYESCKKYEDCKGCPNDVDLDLLPEVMEMAIEALEKQIPKKPTFEDVGNAFGAILRTCGACGDSVLISAKAMEFENYCRRCGVKLKEEGAEE